jgi:asparagine synthase (glutamine-hydrolysing)
MCGIAGIYNYGSRLPVEEQLLREMCRVIEHRGPDDEGYYRQGEFGMGMRRLSIIDVAGGRQPVFSEDDSVGVVFNGEIYNHRDLMRELQKKGHVFRTQCDTEVIVHLYEEMGDGCVTKLRGMFAFALWDGKERKLLLARDRMGKKPLFYWINGQRCLFASEIKSILQDPTLERNLNLEALADYLTYMCVPWPKTIFRGIWKLPPAHLAVVSSRGLRLQQYWDLSFQAKRNGREDYQRRVSEGLLQMLQDSVGCRLESEVPLGAFLSGGVDSSAVVALMAAHKKNPVTTVSIGFHERDYNELPYAEEVARKFCTRHFAHLVEPDALQILEKLVWHFDEPFADSSAVPTYYVCQGAREHVTVALSGDGGDEAFGGYRRYFYDLLENHLRSFLPEFVRRFVVSPLATVYPKADRLPQFLRAKTMLTNLTLSSNRGYYNTRSIFKESMRGDLLRSNVQEELGQYDPYSVLEPHFKRTEGWPHLSRLQYVDMKTYLHDDILVKVDRMSMANSLEVRSPLLDQNLWHFLAGVPPDLKISGRERKFIFKKTLEPILPNEILYRKKRGFSIPLAEWFRGSLKDLGREVFLGSRNQKSDFFEPRSVQAIWEDHQSGRRNYGTHLWTILMFELWHDRYMKRPYRPER